MSDTEKKTIVEEGTEFDGSLSSSCPVVVNGKVVGKVKTPALSISSTGSVHGQVDVGEVVSEGEIAGEFDADVIRLAGKVCDKTVLKAKSLEVKLSTEEGKMQVVFGDSELTVGDDPGPASGGDGAGGRKRSKRRRGGSEGDDSGGEPSA